MTRLVYLLFRIFEFGIRLVPMRVCWWVGSGLGSLCLLLLPGYRRLARRNMRIAFGNEWDESKIRKTVRRHFARLGGNLMGSVKLATMSPAAVARRVRVEGQGTIDDVFAGETGCVFAVGHLGAWEALAQLPSLLPGRRGTLYQSLRNPFIDRHIRRMRSRLGTELFDRKAGFAGPLGVLRDGGGMGVLVDQHAGDAGVWCPFFNRLASTSNLAALLALRAGVPIVPMGVYAEGGGRWRICAEKPLIPREGESTDSVTARLNLAMEKLIRRSPEDWFWVHNRWKTPKPAFLHTHRRYRRGVTIPEEVRPESIKPFRMLVRSPNWLGDAVMAVPAVRRLKRGRMDARVTVLAKENLRALWKSVPEVDDFLPLKPNVSPLAVSREIRKAPDFDLAVLLPNSLRSALEAWFAGIPRRVGFKGHRPAWLLDQIVPEASLSVPPEHQVHRFLRIARHCGADVVSERESLLAPIMPPVAARHEFARVGICAGAEYGPAKRWFPERFAEVVEKVNAQRECEWVLFGARGDWKTGLEVSDLLGGDCRNLVGQTTMEELIEELRHCSLLLTNDTGSMHLAAILGVPTVALFGSTEPALTAPIGDGHKVIRHHVNCSPCFLRDCPLDFRCMKAIDAAEVAAAVNEVLDR